MLAPCGPSAHLPPVFLLSTTQAEALERELDAALAAVQLPPEPAAAAEQGQPHGGQAAAQGRPAGHAEPPAEPAAAAADEQRHTEL